MKSVVIIGAGPAGLVAAKTLLHSRPGTFKVTILEKADRVGGLWPLDKDDPNSMLRPNMRTNLSKYTVAFSDLAWSSVNIRDRHQHTNGARDRETSHFTMFPKAWHVGQYLQAYADKYIPRDSIRVNSEVTSAEWAREGDQYAWAVKWTSQSDRSASEPQVRKGTFDYMIIATGFFAEPRRLSNELSATPPKENAQVRILHSTQLRSLSDLFPDGPLQSNAEKNVVVAGGGMSGAEAAALLALQLSSAQYSPESNKVHEGVKIYHVIARPFYAVPLFLPSTAADSPASGVSSSGAKGDPTFLPLDLVFYDMGRRVGPITPVWGKVKSDKAGSTHRFLQSLIGSDQSDLGSRALLHDEAQRQQPPYVAISQEYAEFVRSGAIIPLYGRMTRVNANEVIVTAEGEIRRIGNVAAIVNATGFSPQVSISWLPKDVLDILEYDDASTRLPLLQDNSVSHPKIPNLGFVGFYEGPYWGVMEMQARTLAKTWAEVGQQYQTEPTGTTVFQKLRAMRQLREDIRKGEGIPQFWMGDYIGLMEGFATDLGIVRNDGVFGGRNGPVVPARYTVDGDDKQEAERMLKDLQETLRASTLQGHFVARAAFRAMQGSWQMRRTLTSLLPNFPSGTFNGVANLHPRYPTDEAFDAEYLYIEDGQLITEQGFTLKASRRYVYRYREYTDKISAWFVKEDGKTVDYFFNEMNFQVPKESANQGVMREEAPERNEGCVAKASHLCVDDMYESVCNFQFQGVGLKRFGIKYVVNGPRKNYVSDTWYERTHTT